MKNTKLKSFKKITYEQREFSAGDITKVVCESVSHPVRRFSSLDSLMFKVGQSTDDRHHVSNLSSDIQFYFTILALPGRSAKNLSIFVTLSVSCQTSDVTK